MGVEAWLELDLGRVLSAKQCIQIVKVVGSHKCPKEMNDMT